MGRDVVLRMDFRSQCVCVVLLPLFFLAFCLLYDPCGVMEYFNLGTLSPELHIVMLSCIILFTLALSRAVLVPLSRRRPLKQWQYAAWCAGEVLAGACLMALYTSLSGASPYAEALACCLKFALLALWIPYLFLMMLGRIRALESESGGGSPGVSPARFYDGNKRLQLSVDKQSLLFIKAEYNYVRIVWLDDGKVAEYMLRSSMKAQEPKAEANGLVRCHRSYFINPRRIRALSRGEEGQMSAILDSPEPLQVPVSRQYYDRLAGMM